MKTVAVLFARSDSVYKTLPGLDVYDIERDARTWSGGCPVVAHPPCRAWGSLRHFAKPRPDEKDLAYFAVNAVRTHGGVLEHPLRSTLWGAAGLPRPGVFDEFGGWSLPVWQSWFGHRADKATLLYIVGCRPTDLPLMPLRLGESSHVVSPSSRIRLGHPRYRPQLRKAEREHTPRPLALWLVEVARRCGPNTQALVA